MGEHQLDKLGVTGSSPVPPIADRNPACCAGPDDFDRLLVSIRAVVAEAGKAGIAGGGIFSAHPSQETVGIETPKGVEAFLT